MDGLRVYLDNNATTGVDPEVLQAMLPFFTEIPGNPGSSGHRFGWEAEEAVELARENVLSCIGSTAGKIVFTAGSTEAINLVISNIRKGHIITVSTEHKAVLASCAALEELGVRTTYLPVDAAGLIDLNLLEDSVERDTRLICVMYANNETGVLQDVSGVAEIAARKGVPYLCDATQAIGKIPVDVKGIDYLACSAHKFYGPKGIGALYINKSINTEKLHPMIHGGSQEFGLRSGTLNVPGIVGLGKACQVVGEQSRVFNGHIKMLRDKIENRLLTVPGAQVNGDRRHRLPNTCNISFDKIDGQMILESLGDEIAVATGSACNAGLGEPSHVLVSMGFTPDRIRGSLRISLGKFNTETEVDLAAKRIEEVIEKLA